MRARRALAVVACCLVAACAPSADTDNAQANALIDMVVAREAPFHDCLQINAGTLVVAYPDDYMAPVMGIYPGAFDDADLNAAASAVAVSPEEAHRQVLAGSVLQILGEPDAIDGSEWCTMAINAPLFVDDVAFVEFMAPGGTIGAYAFKRSFGRWRVAERLHFGFW